MKWKACPTSTVQCSSPKVVPARDDFSSYMTSTAESNQPKLRRRRVSLVRLNMYDRSLRRSGLTESRNNNNISNPAAPGKPTTLVRTSAIRKSNYRKRLHPTSTGQLSLLLSSTVGITAFREFLASEYSENNLDFWLDCEKYKNCGEAKMHTVAAQVVSTYLKPGSAHEVNVSYSSRKFAELKAASCERDAFDHVQENVFKLMSHDSFLRFQTKYPGFMSYLESVRKVIRS
uniref:Regulator of G-protein signaling 5-like n=1 Tax=Ciona intestinalis TaxID=7719 RepID=F6Z7K7_CIOIN|nr:regulator of G-protein signaling 5-like isoform X1 [Ciona intestinalis]|eukprot:XP_002130938.1 regulator of G-protein signaling 5-like isoform X1 [Ciona intestinalis]